MLNGLSEHEIDILLDSTLPCIGYCSVCKEHGFEHLYSAFAGLRHVVPCDNCVTSRIGNFNIRAAATAAGLLVGPRAWGTAYVLEPDNEMEPYEERRPKISQPEYK
jgi:hypothetical protein